MAVFCIDYNILQHAEYALRLPQCNASILLNGGNRPKPAEARWQFNCTSVWDYTSQAPVGLIWSLCTAISLSYTAAISMAPTIFGRGSICDMKGRERGAHVLHILEIIHNMQQLPISKYVKRSLLRSN